MIASVPAAEVPAGMLESVNAQIDAWCRENGIVAEFIRQNPLFRCASGYLRRAENTTVRRNIYRFFDGGRAIASASARRNIRKARKNGLEVAVDGNMRRMADFDRLYAETADRIGMHPYYLFGSGYTASVARLMGDRATLFHVLLDGRAIASSLVFKSKPFCAYHLSGSDTRYRKLYPNDLLLSAILEWADDGPGSVLSFGGGLNDREDDNLYQFKKRFGNSTRSVEVGKNVHDMRTYRAVCDRWEAEHPCLKEKYRNYFLKYRMLQ
jgi:hypothetical protein